MLEFASKIHEVWCAQANGSLVGTTTFFREQRMLRIERTFLPAFSTVARKPESPKPTQFICDRHIMVVQPSMAEVAAVIPDAFVIKIRTGIASLVQRTFTGRGF